VNKALTSPVSGLKYSTVNDTITDAPWFGFGFHVNRTLVSLTSLTDGREGGAGYVDVSGVRRNITSVSDGDSTRRAPLEDVSPVSLTALHVYQPVSVRLSSKLQVGHVTDQQK
jgi:hypothetical protein